MQTLIRGALIVTMNAANEIIRRGDILIADGRIQYVGPTPDSPPPGHLDRIIDGTEFIAMPGLVNAHSHAMSHLCRGLVHGKPLEIWRQYMKAYDRGANAEDLYLSTMLGVMEMLKAGVTTVVDHFYAFLPDENQGAGQVLQAWRAAGIRGVLSPMLIDIGYEQTVPIKVDPNDKGAMAEIERITKHENAESLDGVVRMLKRELGRHPRLHFQIGPGAPHRCTDELLTSARRVAEEFGLRLHMHVGETHPQFRHTRRTFGTTPVGRLHKLGILDDRMTMAHAIWMTADDIELVAAAGTSTVHNPSANMKLGDGIAAVPEQLAAGVNVALGCDGSGSNDVQNLWLEIRAAGMIHNCRFVDYAKWPQAAQVLRMATVNGARSCGLGGEVGSLEVGKKADIALLSRYSPNFMPMNDVQAQMVFGEHGASVDTVLVEGQVVVAGGKLVNVNERAMYQRMEAAMALRHEEMHRHMAGVEPLEPALRDMYFRENAGYQGWLAGPVSE